MSATDQSQAPLPFETWAAISAIDNDAERERRIIESGLMETWPHADEHWSGLLAGDVLKADMRRVRAYAQWLCEDAPAQHAAEQVTKQPIGQPSEQPAEQASEHPAFAAALAGNQQPQRPEPGQQHTAYHRPTSSMRDEMRAAEAASNWTVDQYACFRAELQAAGGHSAGVYARYGLNSRETQEIVTEAWAQRLGSDGAMRARFDAVLNEQNRLRNG